MGKIQQLWLRSASLFAVALSFIKVMVRCQPLLQLCDEFSLPKSTRRAAVVRLKESGPLAGAADRDWTMSEPRLNIPPP